MAGSELTEITQNNWNEDVYPFDETRCSSCGDPIGGYLWIPTYGPYADAGLGGGRFDNFWVDEFAEPFCEEECL